MTVDGGFKLNDNVESAFNAQLLSTVSTLEHDLDAVFPGSAIPFLGFDEHLQLVELVCKARALSFKIQHGVLSCRLVVTKVSATEGSSNIFGTFSLGMDRIQGGDRTVLLDARPITNEHLQSFFA